MSTNRWLMCPRPQPHAPAQLVCFPHAGSGTSPYVAWAADLAPDVEVTIICLPGRERHIGTPAYDVMAPLIDDLAPAISPHLRPPYAIFGHSFGALVAYALARRLQHDGDGPTHLFVSSSIPPHLSHLQPPLYQMEDAQLMAELARYGGLPAELAEMPELFQLMLPTLRADLRIAKTYSAATTDQLRCPITAFGGTGDEFVASDALRQWQALTSAGFGALLLPGGHFYLTDQRPAVLHTIRTAINSYPPTRTRPEEARA